MNDEINYADPQVEPLSSTKLTMISKTAETMQDKPKIHKTQKKGVYRPVKPWIETPLIESAVLSKKAGW